MRGRIMAALLAAGLVGGCAASEEAPVVRPGAPGADPRIASSAEVEKLREVSEPEPEEISYLRRMIPHHEQALRMTELAEHNANHARVRDLADRIEHTQRPEIDMMHGWLQRRDVAMPHEQPGHAAHGDMPGMATPQQLAELSAARGVDFDRLFLRVMNEHHEGAVDMATQYLAEGHDEQVHSMAQDVLVTQTSEIAAMRKLSETLDG